MDRLPSATYTIVNPRTGGYRTIKVSEPDRSYWKDLRPGTRIASFLSGSDNETSFTGFAFVWPGGTATVWRSRVGMVAEAAALNWLLAHGAKRGTDCLKAYAAISGRCGFCSLKLTTPESLHFGYGSDCAAKHGLPYHSISRVTQVEATEPKVSILDLAERVAGNRATQVGWQQVKPLRTYEELFGEDDR